MARYQITCINKREGHYDPHARIQYVGEQGHWKLSEESAIRHIESGQDSFYTSVNNRHAEVIVATHNGRQYLKTAADDYAPNNLLALPECHSCRLIE
jgi:hypothetical protein